MKFQSLKISDWKQFGSIDVAFHPRLTVLTGANGSGKTTILNVLARHFGWNCQELSTPAKDEETGIVKWFVRFFKKPSAAKDDAIGEVRYSNGRSTPLRVPQTSALQYAIEIPQPQPVQGFHIPSHRTTFTYQSVDNISTRKRKRKDAFDIVSSSVKTRYFGSGGHPSNYYIKETLLGWALFGFGTDVVEADVEAREAYLGFQEVLTTVLPESLGFKQMLVRNHEIVLITDSGDFVIDAVSGGIAAIIDLAWQVYMFGADANANFTVLIDEVENHLHATMQRALLPTFIKAFPNVQFVVSTHSPLIVGSVKDSLVYVLRYEPDRRIASLKLDLVNKAKGANDILREVLGVPFTMPIWVEEELSRIVKKYAGESLKAETAKALRSDLKTMGLEEMVPDALVRVADQQ